MKQKAILRLIPLALMFAFLATGCMKETGPSAQAPAPKAAEQKADANVYIGSVVGKSNKAKTISIAVGQGDAAKTMMVRFDEKTEGTEFAKKAKPQSSSGNSGAMRNLPPLSSRSLPNSLKESPR